jgi:cystathionine gamma-lyase
MSQKKLSIATRAIRVGEGPDFIGKVKNDVVVPIHLSSTYARKEVENPEFFQYSRSDNPTRFALEQKYASLENAKYALAFASGLAAESAVLFSLLKTGDHIVAFQDLYGGTKRIFNQLHENFGVNITYVDATNLSKIESAIIPETKIIWLESPTNPLLNICDIKAIAGIAKNGNITVVVDNTFLSPYFQNPLDLGADIVLHSATKYLSGHSDVISGAVMLSDENLYQKIKFNQNAFGAVPSPFDCYLIIRGIKTLAVRMEQHNRNAIKIAQFLETHPKVKKVTYPGLQSHPQYELGKLQSRGAGGMIAFELKGNIDAAKKFLESLELFILAESLGGVESLIEHPALMTHSSLPKDVLVKTGITETLIRVSIGIEDPDDLISDLWQALENI